MGDNAIVSPGKRPHRALRETPSRRTGHHPSSRERDGEPAEAEDQAQDARGPRSSGARGPRGERIRDSWPISPRFTRPEGAPEPEGAPAAARDLGKRRQPARRGPTRGVNRGVFGQKPGSARRAGEPGRGRSRERGPGTRAATGAGRGGPQAGGARVAAPPRTPSGEPAPGRPTGRTRHEIRRRPGRKNTGRPGANCPQGSGRSGHPRPSEAKRTRPGRSRNPSDRAAPGESGCPPSRRCGECATWPC